jgi:hypothetical protein
MAVGEVIRATVLRDRRAEPVRSVLEVTWPIQPGLTVDEIIDVLSSQTPRWRQMLELPHNATDAVAVEAIEEARRKGGRDVPLVRPIHLIEGPAVQILHLGSDDGDLDVRIEESRAMRSSAVVCQLPSSDEDARCRVRRARRSVLAISWRRPGRVNRGPTKANPDGPGEEDRRRCECEPDQHNAGGRQSRYAERQPH